MGIQLINKALGIFALRSLFSSLDIYIIEITATPGQLRFVPFPDWLKPPQER